VPVTGQAVWDPFGTLREALWIGGGQWAGKSTVARILARRYGLTAYHYDYHDARGHEDRRIARRVRRGEAPFRPEPDAVWVSGTPEQMAADTLAGFPLRFDWALDDLRALVSGHPIVAEGWGLRPELVAAITDAPRRMVVMVATEEFRLRQVSSLPRAAALGPAGQRPRAGAAQPARPGPHRCRGCRQFRPPPWHPRHRGRRNPGRRRDRRHCGGPFRPISRLITMPG
jgi:hypothetical protein